MRGIYKLLSVLAAILSFGRSGPAGMARNQARRYAIRGVTRGLRKWGL